MGFGEGKGTRSLGAEGLADDGKRFLAMDVLKTTRSSIFYIDKGRVSGRGKARDFRGIEGWRIAPVIGKMLLTAHFKGVPFGGHFGTILEPFWGPF